MKIADALLLQQDLSQEISRLKGLAEQKTWGFMQRGTGEELIPFFDVEENHKLIKKISKLKRRLSRAVSLANNTVELSIDDSDYSEWL